MRLSKLIICAAVSMVALSSCKSSPNEQAPFHNDDPDVASDVAMDAGAAGADAAGAQAQAAPGDDDTAAAIP